MQSYGHKITLQEFQQKCPTSTLSKCFLPIHFSANHNVGLHAMFHVSAVLQYSLSIWQIVHSNSISHCCSECNCFDAQNHSKAVHERTWAAGCTTTFNRLQQFHKKKPTHCNAILLCCYWNVVHLGTPLNRCVGFVLWRVIKWWVLAWASCGVRFFSAKNPNRDKVFAFYFGPNRPSKRAWCHSHSLNRCLGQIGKGPKLLLSVYSNENDF